MDRIWPDASTISRSSVGSWAYSPIDEIRKKRFFQAHDDHRFVFVDLLEIERRVRHVKHGHLFKQRIHRVADGKIGCMGVAHHLLVQGGRSQFMDEGGIRRELKKRS